MLCRLYLNKTGKNENLSLKRILAFSSDLFQVGTLEDGPLSFVFLLCSLTTAGNIRAAVELPPIMRLQNLHEFLHSWELLKTHTCQKVNL